MACKQNVHLRYTCLVFCSWSKGKSLSHAVEQHLWCSTWSPVQTEGKSQCGVETTVRLPLNEMFPPNQEQQSFILSVISWLSASFCSDLPPKSPCVSLSTIHHLGSKMRSHCITSQPVFPAFCFTAPVTAYSFSFIFTASMSTTKSISQGQGVCLF